MTTERPHDVNAMAKQVVDEAEGEKEPEPVDAKRQARLEASSRGGKKGGKARAEKLSPQRRSDIARKAAEARWRRR